MKALEHHLAFVAQVGEKGRLMRVGASRDNLTGAASIALVGELVDQLGRTKLAQCHHRRPTGPGGCRQHSMQAYDEKEVKMESRKSHMARSQRPVATTLTSGRTACSAAAESATDNTLEET